MHGQEGSSSQEAGKITIQTGLLNTSPVPVAHAKIACEVIPLAISIALSYTFSMMIFVIAIMAGHMPASSKDNNYNLASSTLTMGMLYSLVLFIVSPAFVINYIVSPIYGEITELNKRSPVNPQEISTKEQQIAKLLKPGILITSINAVVALPFLVFAQAILTNVFRQDENIAQLTQDFTRPYALAVPALLTRMCLEQVLFGYKKQLYTVISSIAGLAAGTGLAYLFCFSLNMGFTGVAYGYVIEAYLTTALYAYFLATLKDVRNIQFSREFFKWEGVKAEWASVRGIGQAGWPITLTVASQVIIPALLGNMAGWISAEALTIQSLCAWLIFFLNVLVLGLGQAVSQSVGRLMGEALKSAQPDGLLTKNDFISASRAARTGLTTATLFIAVLCGLAAAFPEVLKRIVSNVQNLNNSDPAIASNALIITAAGVVFETMGNGMSQTLRQLGENSLPTQVTTASLWGSAIIGAILAFPAKLEIYGIATAYLLGNLFTMLGLTKTWLEKTRPESFVPTTGTRPEQSLLCCWKARGASTESIQAESSERLLGAA